MGRFWRQSTKSEFVRNVRRLMIGSGMAQAITLLSTLVVARLFDPEDFGAAAIFMSVTMTASVIGSLRYEQAVVLPESDEVAKRLLQLAILLTVATSLTMLIVLVGIGVAAPEFVWLKQLGIWFYVIPLAVFIASVSNALMSWWTRKKAFGRLGTGPVALSTTTAGIRIGLGYIWGSTVTGLVLGALSGMLAKLIVFSRGVFRELSECRTSLREPPPRMRTIAHEYREFPKYSALAAFVKKLGEDLPLLLLSLMFMPAVAGFFAIANRLIRLPVGLVSESVRKVYLQRSAQRLNNGKGLRGDLLMMTLAMLGIGLIPAMLLMIGGPWLFASLLGEKWTTAGEYTVILAPWLLAVFAAGPASTVYIILRRQALWLRMQLSRTIVMGGALYLPYLLGGGVIDCLTAFMIVGLLANVSVIMTALHLCANHDKYTVKDSPHAD